MLEAGLILYLIAMLTMAGIYAVMVLGLNLQWGAGGLFNVGIAGFFGIGAYTSAILTTASSSRHLGGFELPIAVGLAGAIITSGIVAWAIGRVCLRLRSDYLAIATIGIAEILRLILKNEQWMTNGALGIGHIPRPFEELPQGYSQLGFLAVVLCLVAAVYWLWQRALAGPWGRTMRAIRDNEHAAAAMGKDIEAYRLQAFVLGSMAMGLGGALMAHHSKFMGPEAIEPVQTTFLVWVMLIVGGQGNNRGAVLGALVVWMIWSGTQLLTTQLPPEWSTRAGYLRVFLIGLCLQIVLQRFAQGILPERTGRPAQRQRV